MMAIDFLIFAVLLLSFVINFLALAAFWVTPGLRTTANRFTINLVIINLVGCVILAPTLFLSGGGDVDGGEDGVVAVSSNSITTGSIESGLSFLSPNANDDSIEFYSKPGNHQMTIRHNGRLVEQDGIILRRNISSQQQQQAGIGEDTARTIETIYKCNATFCRELTIDEGVETLVITEIQEETQNPAPDTEEVNESVPTTQIFMRSWAIDMAAALGAMAVLLVVGDTWCAVTDPLRYHSRISGVKSWMLIAGTWAMGILFGVLSAFREIDFESDTVINKQKRFTASESATFFSLSSANNIFSVVFSCLYFLLIILLPFGFVCGMYWRIFSEARENGLRMRQNGSSPLLQSALNLNQGQQVGLQHYSNSLCIHRNSVSSTSSHCGGLQMQIDQQQQKRSSPACPRRDSAAKVLLPPISDDGLSECDVDVSVNEGVQQQAQTQLQAQPQQNIILTLQTASGEIKRNYSTRQLELLASSSQELCGTHGSGAGIRQVHSTPNLQRSITLPQPLTADVGSPHLLGGHLPQNVPSIHLLRHTFQQNHHARHLSHQQHQHSLQIPAIHASPKALSYMSSLRHRLSNASSLFKYREESRAARISILVVIMFLVSYLPYGFLVLLQSRVPTANFPGSGQLAVFMILLANLSSPFIFAYRNKRVRRGVKRLVGLDSSQLQRHSGSNSRLSASKCGSQLKRNSSRVSTYSTNSGRYLTPQSSLASNNNNNNNSINVPLRPNSSCSTIINFALNNNNNNHQSDNKSFDEEDQRRDQTTTRTRPLLQRGITIIEHVPLNGSSTPKTPVKKKLCKLFFKNSKNRSYATRQTSIQSSLDGGEPTDV